MQPLANPRAERFGAPIAISLVVLKFVAREAQEADLNKVT
jgi:hypothetical protein